MAACDCFDDLTGVPDGDRCDSCKATRATFINVYDPFSDTHNDAAIEHGQGAYAGQIIHGCEGAIGLHWTPAEAREAARKLLVMADEIDAPA